MREGWKFIILVQSVTRQILDECKLNKNFDPGLCWASWTHVQAHHLRIEQWWDQVCQDLQGWAHVDCQLQEGFGPPLPDQVGCLLNAMEATKQQQCELDIFFVVVD